MRIGSKEIDLIKVYILLMSIAVLVLGAWVFLTYRSFDEYRVRHIRLGKERLKEIVVDVERLKKNYTLYKDKPPINYEEEERDIYSRLDECAARADIADFPNIAERRPRKKEWEPYNPSRKSGGQKIEQKIWTIDFNKTMLPLEKLVRFLFNIENRIQGVKVTKIQTNRIDEKNFEWESPSIEIAFFRKAQAKSRT